MTTENPNPTPEKTTPSRTSSRSRSTAKKETKEEVVALSVKDKESTVLGLPNNRPIEPSHLHITSTYRSVGGDRPVTEGLMEISGTMEVSGHRPIAASHLQVSETYVVMGNRPVASNETDDMATLIGYLD